MTSPSTEDTRPEAGPQPPTLEQQIAAARSAARWLLPRHWLKQLASAEPPDFSPNDASRLLAARLLAVLNDVQPDPTPSNIVAVLLLGIVPLTEQEMARTVEICSVSLHLRETSVDLLPPLARLALFMEIPSIVLDLLILHSEGAMVVALASQMICAVSTVVMSPLYTPCILRNWRKLQVACAQTLSRLGSPTGVPALLDAAVNGPAACTRGSRGGS